MKWLFFGLAVVVLFMFLMLYRNFAIPEHIGVQNGALSPLPSTPNAVSSQTVDDLRRVEPLPFVGSLEESRERVITALGQVKSISILKSEPFYIHTIDISESMKFRDDIEFLFVAEKRVIEFRSASRVGYSDGGVNLKRYELLRSFYLGN